MNLSQEIGGIVSKHTADPLVGEQRGKPPFLSGQWHTAYRTRFCRFL